MTTPPPPRRPGKPRKVISDEARAEALMEELRQGEALIRQTMERRLEIALEAHGIGMTTTKIGEEAGVSQAAVSKWLRIARDRGSH